MSARVKIRPSREQKSAKARRRRSRTQAGKERDVSADRFSEAHGRKTMRPRESPVNTHIRAFGIYVNQNTRTSIQQKTDRKFRKFAKSIERMSVRLKDVNGPRGGVDHVCRIKVVLRDLPSVVYEKQDSSPDTAFGGALAGAERAVRRTLQRLRAKPVRKRQRSA